MGLSNKTEPMTRKDAMEQHSSRDYRGPRRFTPKETLEYMHDLLVQLEMMADAINHLELRGHLRASLDAAESTLDRS